MTTAWLMIAAGEDRQHGGNQGYDDDPERHYSWDNTVANHRKPRNGHIIVLWDKRNLIGAHTQYPFRAAAPVRSTPSGRQTKNSLPCTTITRPVR